MVLHTSHPVSPALFNNKENVIFKSPSSVLRNANGRRPRSRANNAPSPILIAREAARDPGRRRAQSPSTATAPQTLRFAVDGADVEMTDLTTPSASRCPQRCIQLPRYLRRPAFKEISPAALEAIDADLKGVAMEYIHEKLEMMGQQLFAVAVTTTAKPPRDRLPRELEVVVKQPGADAPTHLFAVYSRPATQVTIHPAHALVLAAHCANLPSLPSPKPATSSDVENTFTLPVVPLCVPNAATFPILLRYLYTKRSDHLLVSLLPMPPQDMTQSLDELSNTFAATFTVQALLAHAAKVHGLWSNTAALGVFDKTLWRGIEMAWEVLLSALALSTGSTWRTESASASQL